MRPSMNFIQSELFQNPGLYTPRYSPFNPLRVDRDHWAGDPFFAWHAATPYEPITPGWYFIQESEAPGLFKQSASQSGRSCWFEGIALHSDSGLSFRSRNFSMNHPYPLPENMNEMTLLVFSNWGGSVTGSEEIQTAFDVQDAANLNRVYVNHPSSEVNSQIKNGSWYEVRSTNDQAVVDVPMVWGITLDKDVLSAWKEGLVKGTKAVPGFEFDWSTYGDSCYCSVGAQFGYRHHSAWTHFKGHIHLVACWPRAFSSGEMMSLAKDPFQFTKSRSL